MIPKAVIIDMDGTLVDSEEIMTSAAIKFFKDIGQEVSAEDFKPFLGMGDDKYLGGVAENKGVKIDVADAKAKVYKNYLEMIPGNLKMYKGADYLFRRLKEEENLKVALASSADRIKVEANLREIGLPPEEWDLVTCGNEVEFPKPAPDIFVETALNLKVSCIDCCVIEDSPSGVEAAKLASMRCVAVTHTHTEEELFRADSIKMNLLNIRLSDLSVLGIEPEEPTIEIS